MRKKQEFNDILDDCVERILSQGDTVGQCLARYPEQASELESLLQTVSLAKVTSYIEPSSEFKEKARHEFRMALQETELPRNHWTLGWRPQWVTAIVSVLILLLASGGTLAMAGNSMPDELLYPVKRVTEVARIALIPSSLGKAELYVNLADNRVAEIVAMVEENKSTEVEKAAQLLSEHLIAMAGLVGLQEKQQAKEVATFMAPSPAVEEAPQTAMEKESGVTFEEASPPSVEKETPSVDKRATPALAPEAQKLPEPSASDKAGAAEDEAIRREDIELEEQTRLKALLAHQAFAHREALYVVLEKAPESVKPALRQAIDITESAYAEALKVLD
ncbi:DUF5667 domain-containing protein [Chloroflexota bacterium]